jgi:hypothetical protein
MNKNRRLEILAGLIGVFSLLVALVSLFADLRSLDEIKIDLSTLISVSLFGFLVIATGLVLFVMLSGKLNSEIFMRILSSVGVNLLSYQISKLSKLEGEQQQDNVNVINAVVEARRGTVSPDQLAELIAERINSGYLKPEVGAEILAEFNYVLVVQSDGKYDSLRSPKPTTEVVDSQSKGEERNRIAFLLEDMASKFELPYKTDADTLGLSLGLPAKDKMIIVNYVLDEAEDSYVFGAALGQIDESNLPKISKKLATSEPIMGITERIEEHGKFIVMGSRDNLRRLSDTDIERTFMDDLARIAKVYDQFEALIS